MAKFSTGLRNVVANTSPYKTALNLGFLKIYGGTVPADADAALGAATLAVTLSNAGTATGLTFDSATTGVLPKKSTETWSGTNVAAVNPATFFRYVIAGDTGAASTTEVRLQGTVAQGGADVNVGSLDFINGAPALVDFFNITLPASN
jgi:hypothetical protein